MSASTTDSACQILLVIHEAAERARYRGLLQARSRGDYQVTEASTSQEALAILAQLNVDCVLVSSRMPDMDFDETLACLAATAPESPRAMILLVPTEQAASAHHAIQLGAEDILVEDPALTSEGLGLAVAKSLARVKFASEQGGRLQELQRTVDNLGNQINLRDEFLSIAAHELKTPIAAAKLKFQTSLKLLGLAKASPLPPPVEKIVKLLQDGDHQMSRLTRLIDNLLDLSRLESGQLTLHTQRMDLASLLRDVVARFSQQFVYAGCTTTIDAPTSLEGDWDPDRLDQVVTNLLTNAIRYASGTPVKVELMAAGNGVELRVADGGPGVDPASRERIFERYERAGGPTRVRGLGLGLYITREIVQAHGGTIRVEGEPGEGARFVVKLPPALN